MSSAACVVAGPGWLPQLLPVVRLGPLFCWMYSGRPVEYAILLVTSREAGRRESTIGFDVGQGTQDLGFRGEVPVLFRVRTAKDE